MRRGGIILLWLGLLTPTLTARAQAPTPPAGYTIEPYVTGLTNPTGLAFSPGGAFGYEGQLFVSDRQVPAGTVYRVPSKGVKIVFVATTVGTPNAIAIPPAGSKLGPYLYVLGQEPPKLRRYDAKGAGEDFGAVNNHSLALAIGRGGAWGGDLYHLDSSSGGAGEGVCRWAPGGGMARVVGKLREELQGMAFARGGAFGEDLYLGFGRWDGSAPWPHKAPAALYRLDAAGRMKLFVQSPLLRNPCALAFDPTGNFRDHLFVTDNQRNKIFEVDAKGDVRTFLSGLRFGAAWAHWSWAGGDIAFGPDGAMYVGENTTGTVWRIAAKGLPFPRDRSTDTVILAEDRTLRGTIRNKGFALRTVLGPLTLPAGRVVGMATRPKGTVRVLLTDGQVVHGSPDDGALELLLPDGTNRRVAMKDIRRWGYRVSAGRPQRPTLTGPVAILRTGDRLAVSLEGLRIKLHAGLTGRGETVDLASLSKGLAEILPDPGDPAAHRLLFENGSALTAVLSPAAIRARLAPRVALALGRQVTRLRLGASRPGATWLTRLELVGGDVLLGQIASPALHVRTPAGAVECRPTDVKTALPLQTGLAPMVIRRWNGEATVGPLTGSLEFEILPGPTLSIPAGRIAGIFRVAPLRPGELVERIEGLIEQLGADRYEARQRATRALIHMPAAVRGLLERHRDHADLEVRERIRIILTAQGAS